MKRRIYGLIKLLLFMPFFVLLVLGLTGFFVLLPFIVLIEPRILDDVIDRLEGRK
jgi:hypothetical protein